MRFENIRKMFYNSSVILIPMSQSSFLQKIKSVVLTDEPNIEDFFREKKANGFAPPNENGKAHDESPLFGSDETKAWSKEATYEGQLSVDVYQDRDAMIVESTIAGVAPEDLDISLNNDMLTIKGMRAHHHKINEEDYFYRECYWGGFSRSIILPVDVVADRVEAKLSNGVLTIRLPKAKKSSSRVIPVKI